MSSSASRARMKNAYEIEKGLKASLESTSKGLESLLRSLRDSGMADGAAGYRAPQMVLVQQRLWAHSHRRAALQPLFRSIAKTAGELHRIFSAYAEATRVLRDLDRITSAPPAAPGEDPPGGGAGG